MNKKEERRGTPLPVKRRDSDLIGESMTDTKMMVLKFADMKSGPSQPPRMTCMGAEKNAPSRVDFASSLGMSH